MPGVLGSWDVQWGQDDAFGSYKKNDGGSGNITVPSAGYYRITLNTATDELTIEPYDQTPTVFSGIAIMGGWDSWANDVVMNPCSASANNHDWYLEYTLDAGTAFKFKQAGSWDYNKGGVFIAEGTDVLYGFGVGNGDNLVIPETGTYTLLFNDITGVFRLIKK